MIVKCPNCEREFETRPVGDLVACPDCNKPFRRFTNAIEDT